MMKRWRGISFLRHKGNIVCVQTSKRNYLEISDKTGLSHHTRLTFSSVSEILTADPRFLLINQGVIVNMDHIERVGNECKRISYISPLMVSGDPGSRALLRSYEGQA